MSNPLAPWRADDTSPTGSLLLADILDLLSARPLPFHFTAYDGSESGPVDSPIRLHLATPRGAAYIATAPGSLGLARAYIQGDLLVEGTHPAYPYEMLKSLRAMEWRRPSAANLARIAKALGVQRLIPPPPPAQEALRDWRRMLEGFRHSKTRDAEAIHHHYDVSNRFYELLLGPSMTYTCACYPTADATLEEAQATKYDLVARKLGLQPGMRLLDVGCGWGGMVRHAVKHYGVTAVGVTLSKEQASWAAEEIERQGLSGRAEVRYGDYRDITETGFDAVSSIGLTEHIGVKNYPAYFAFLRTKLRPGGRLLNHSITRPENKHPSRVRGGFIDRYIFPDGEASGVGTMVSEMQDAGIEVRHEENLREHYAKTCEAWSMNLMANWDECVKEAGESTSRIWGVYLAGCQLGFEDDQVELHQVLGVRLGDDKVSGLALRPDWGGV